MIVGSAQFAELAGHVTMVDGGFDPIHPGHLAYFRAAAELGFPVLCNVAPDSWVARKHPVLLTQAERGAVLDAMRDIAYVHLAPGATLDVLRELRPAVYAKGVDWIGRLPAAEAAACTELGIEVAYLDTVLASSTALLARSRGGIEEHPDRRR